MRIGVAGAALPLIAAGPLLGQVRIQGLGPTPAGDIRDTSTFAMSSDGSTIVAGVNGRAFRWREAEGWSELRPLPAAGLQGATAAGVSADGRFVVGTSNSATVPSAAEAVIWDDLGPPLALGDLPGGSFNSFGMGVSADGSVVVGASNATDSGPVALFRWVRGQGMINLGGQASPSATAELTSGAFCSADGGTVFGRVSDGNSQAPARWRNGWTILGDLPGGSAAGWVRGMSPGGECAVGESSSAEGAEAYLWSEGRGMEWLGLSPFGTTTGTAAYGVSEHGSVVVGSGPTGWLSQATIWDRGHGWRNLKLLLLTDYAMPEANGWTMSFAFAVSADGATIAGRGTNPCGRDDIWLVRLRPPTPACAADFNGDGFLDFFDYDDFIGAFEGGRPRADFNGDCFVDFFDYDAFVEAFEAGC